MVYVCGNENDYNEWAAAGNTGWDYASILPLIKKSEGNVNSNIVNYSNGTYHSTTGPLTVSLYNYADEFLPVFKQAVTQAGYNQNVDFNAKEYNGFVNAQATIRDGESKIAT